eukprot:TRINITY_DN86771_c0_g1_i1.p1 TRINITY_DN86771_c0_g1~~TRINITY_DN86771_c0_g1_i1.p1  ORF type:complete len:215 (-),score=27.23 TRINITY_DN86771_c0_g1_i1:90-734(-)
MKGFWWLIVPGAFLVVILILVALHLHYRRKHGNYEVEGDFYRADGHVPGMMARSLSPGAVQVELYTELFRHRLEFLTNLNRMYALAQHAKRELFETFSFDLQLDITRVDLPDTDYYDYEDLNIDGVDIELGCVDPHNCQEMCPSPVPGTPNSGLLVTLPASGAVGTTSGRFSPSIPWEATCTASVVVDKIDQRFTPPVLLEDLGPPGARAKRAN